MMLRESKNVDLSTSGKQPSGVDFARISEWISKKKGKTTRLKKSSRKKAEHAGKK